MAYDPSEPRNKDGEWSGSGGGGTLPGHAKTNKAPMRGLTGEVIVEPMRSMVGRQGFDLTGKELSRAALARAITNRDSASLVGRAYNEATHANVLTPTGEDESIWKLGGAGHKKRSVIKQPPQRGGTFTGILGGADTFGGRKG